MKKVNWKEVIIFFVLATLISAPFRLRWVTLPEGFTLAGGLHIFFYVLRGIGPLIAYLIIYRIFHSKVPKTNTFAGVKPIASWLAIIVIPIGLGITGLPNSFGLNEHYFGLIFGIMLGLYGLAEEYGWRGYLQQALAPLPEPARVFVIALLWYTWHLNFLVGTPTLQSQLIHFGSLVAGSWGILKVTQKTHSLLFASAVHLSFNLLADTTGDFTSRLYVVLAAVVVWIICLRRI